MARRPDYRCVVHVSDRNGHRGDYQDLFSSLLRMRPLVGPVRSGLMIKMVFARKLLFATVPAACTRYILVALARALLLKPTCALFLGAIQIESPRNGLKSSLSLKLVKLAKRIPSISFLSIVPYTLVPNVQKFTRDWIFDPQMWDLDALPPERAAPSTLLAQSVAEAANGKIVVLFAGRASKNKGFHELLDFAEQHGRGVFVVSAGRVDDCCLDIAERLSAIGMRVENRFIFEDELLDLYDVASFAWCLYRSTYDRPSGVFGRAVQADVVPIVRDGSFLHRFAMEYQLPVVPVRSDEACSERLLHELQSQSAQRQVGRTNLNDKIHKMKVASVAKIKRCLRFEV